MVRTTGRLSLAPDEHSDLSSIGWSPQTKERPRSSPGAANTRCGAGPTHNPSTEGADMAKRTRSPGQTDSGTSASAVKITPAREQGPVTSTPTVA